MGHGATTTTHPRCGVAPRGTAGRAAVATVVRLALLAGRHARPGGAERSSIRRMLSEPSAHPQDAVMVRTNDTGRPESDPTVMLGLVILVVVAVLLAVAVGVAFGLFIGSISAPR